MTTDDYEAVLQEVISVFHCDRAGAEAFARYCASTERTALDEVTIERGLSSTASPATEGECSAAVEDRQTSVVVVLHGTKTSVLVGANGLIREVASWEVPSLQTV